MAVASERSINIQFSGDVAAGFNLEAAANAVSPANIEIADLALGNNSIAVPVAGSTVPTAVTIVPPEDNTTALTLKGVSGDTGIRLHDTDPAVISLDDSVTAIVIHAATTTTGVRLYWT